MSRECRICLSDEDAKNLIAPCLCKGSARWIHRQCLDQWRATKSMKDAFTHCGTCKFKYVIKTRVDKSESTQLWRYRLLVFRDSLLFLIVAHLLISLIALILQYVFPKGLLSPTVYELPEDEDPIVKEFFNQPEEDPGFWHFYIMALIVFFFLLGLVYIFLKMFTNILPENMWFPQGIRGNYYGDRWWHTRDGVGARDAAGGIIVFMAFMLVLIGIFMAIGIGAYLIERLLRRHYKITWFLAETQKYVVADLSNDEEHQPLTEKLTEESDTTTNTTDSKGHEE